MMKTIDLNNFTVDDVSLSDIAHNLSKIQRFNGAVPIDLTYFVGEHSINLAHCFEDSPAGIIKCALLYDAPAAYIGDLLPAVKATLNGFHELESKIRDVIYAKFGLTDVYALCKMTIEHADREMVLNEIEELVEGDFNVLSERGCGLVYNNYSSTVKQCFLTLAKRLGMI